MLKRARSFLHLCPHGPLPTQPGGGDKGWRDRRRADVTLLPSPGMSSTCFIWMFLC